MIKNTLISISLMSCFFFACTKDDDVAEDINDSVALEDSVVIVTEDPIILENITSTILTEAVFSTGIEGPAMDANGNLYVVNYEKNGTIGRVDTITGNVELFVELPTGSIGNGIRFHADGDLLVADYTGHNILKINPITKNITTYAHSDALNQPNDIAIMSNGILLASDPNWSKSTGNIWRVDVNGTFVLLADDMGTTNGIEVNPENNLLYVNESVQRKVWVFDLNEKGEISNKRLFYEFEDEGMDGMRCDEKGNLYIARFGKGEIAVLSPEAKLVQTVTLHGEKPTNVTFSETGTTCFVTLQDKGWVETFKATFRGRKE